MSPRECLLDYIGSPGEVDDLVEFLAAEGFVIVPRKATEAMINATDPGYGPDCASAESHWNTMIAEANKP